jgi:hypothetical protein
MATRRTSDIEEAFVLPSGQSPIRSAGFGPLLALRINPECKESGQKTAVGGTRPMRQERFLNEVRHDRLATLNVN